MVIGAYIYIYIYMYVYVSVVSSNTYLSGGFTQKKKKKKILSGGKTVGSELSEQWGQDGV